MTVLEEIFLSPQDSRRSQGSLRLSNLDEFISKTLDEEVKQLHHKKEPDGVSRGRLGAEKVVLDLRDKVGTSKISDDKFSITSYCSFLSVRANVCVFAGKWQYEVLMGSKGLMQLGWCTRNCKFSQELGVGDTEASYAYCGCRQLKWNGAVGEEYGEMWMAGDVISCTIDCDEGIVAFYKNGKAMGDAFRDIKLGPGMAYFPGVSLSPADHVTLNFGGTPLRYPIPGFQPLQAPPVQSVHTANLLCHYLDNLVDYYTGSDSDSRILASRLNLQLSVHHQFGTEIPASTRESISDRAKLLLIGSHIFQRLGPLLKNCYVVERCLMPLFFKGCEIDKWSEPQGRVNMLLDLLSGLLQEHEYQVCLEQLMVSLMSHYRYSPCHMGYILQKRNMCVMLGLLKHAPTRKHLLEHVLFSKAKFPLVMHIRPPEEATLEAIVPVVWWEKDVKSEQGDGPKPSLSVEEAECKEAYLASCRRFGVQLKDLEDMQCEMIRVLMSEGDGGRLSSRQLFLQKLRMFVKGNVFDLGVCEYPWPVGLSFFHRLVKVCRELWDEQHNLCTDGLIPRSEDAYVSLERFYDGSIQYFEAGRLGGLVSHLKKEHKDLIKETIPGNQAEEVTDTTKDSGIEQAEEADEAVGAGASNTSHKSPVHDLQGLIDSLAWLYYNSGHKQISKLATIRESVQDQERMLRDLRKKLQKCPDDLPFVRRELERSKAVFEKLMTKQARQMSWLIGVVFTTEKRDDVYWLHRVLLRTFELCSSKGPLFTFLPEFYMLNTVHTYQAIRSHFNPTVSFKSIDGYEDTLHKYSLFLINHYSDTRVVSSNCKDAMVQALATYVCFPDTLKSLESVHPLNRLQLVKALVVPYEDRSWAQSNWILLRFWKGDGWAFRYKLAPHLAHIKGMVVDVFGGASLQEPCPSEVFQTHIAEYLHQDPELATKFVDSLLNQLNWSFSEFIGMLQELQSLSMRTNSAMIDGRQLKICATCFDIAVALLRVVEMTTKLVPEVYLDFERPSAELLLCRLCQSLCQIMNRVLSKSQSLFEVIVSARIPNFETVDHFPIISALVGTMVQLLCRTEGQSKERATVAMLSEPSFQISCLELLTHSQQEEEVEGATAKGDKEKKEIKLGFSNYPEEVTPAEVEEVDTLIAHLKHEKTLLRSISEELDENTVCNICYATSQSVVFIPCGHRSCRACIAHHMMIKKECFFCKATIDRVESITEGTPV